MALVVETGTGLPNADSWVALEDLDTYWADRNLQEWTEADEDAREAAARNAADYLMIAYRYPGQPTTFQQRLPWPRAGVPSGGSVFPNNAVPSQIINAQMVLAVEALNTNLLVKPKPAERQLIEETKSAKGFSKSLKYQVAPVDPISGLVRFPTIDVMLTGISMRNGGGDIGSVKLLKGL